MKCRNFSSLHKTSFFEKQHIANEHSESLSDGKLHCFSKQYWNQNISFLSASTLVRECVLVRCLDIFSKTEGYRGISISSLPSKSFLPSLLQNPGENFFFFKSDKRERNFDFETKVWDKMPTERENILFDLSHSIYRSKQTRGRFGPIRVGRVYNLRALRREK